MWLFLKTYEGKKTLNPCSHPNLSLNWLAFYFLSFAALYRQAHLPSSLHGFHETVLKKSEEWNFWAIVGLDSVPQKRVVMGVAHFQITFSLQKVCVSF